ncbi:MAG: maleylpyruvate isomerase family mycothiol-dependent enzyme [Actinomycetes bacterium]
MENSFDATTINRQVEGLAASHQLFLERLEGLTNDMVSRPSLLSDWSVGHVLAHIAQQGDSITRLFLAAELGEVVDQYEGGFAARVAAIDEAASRSAEEHVNDIRRSIYALEGAIASAREGWFGSARMVSGIEVRVTDLPLRRWREVEVHMGDLGLAELQCVGPDSWSLDYVRHDLSVMTMQWKSRGSMGLTDLPEQIRTQSPSVRLGWLLGRVIIDGLAPAGLMG